MARIPIPVVDVATRGGVILGATSGGEINGDTVNGHSIAANDGSILLHARNSAVGTITLTILPSFTVDGFTLPSRVITRVGVGDVLIGPFPQSMFTDVVNIDVNSANWRLRSYRIAGQRSRAATPPVGVAAGSRVALPLTTITRAGIDITAGVSEVVGDSVNRHYFPNDGNVVILARATSIDTTYNPVSSFLMDGLAVPDYSALVQAASPLELAGPYPPALYNQVDGNVYMNVVSNTLRLRALWFPFQD